MRNKYSKYNKETLEVVVKESGSWFEVCVKLDLNPVTGAQTHIKKRVVGYEIDFSHFRGQGWRKDREFLNERVDITEYLNNNRFIKSSSLRSKLIKCGYKGSNCEICGLSKWNNESIPLELDHINSNHFDNRLENLQIICPNCHALETLKRRKKPEKIKIERTRKSKGVPKPRQRKVIRPSLEILLSEIKETNYCAVGRKYGVSDNCIRKWIKWESAGMVDNSVLETEVK